MTSKLNPAAKKYYGDVAKDYDKLRSERSLTAADDAIIAAFLDGCEKGSVVLDMPAGTGRALSAVLDRDLEYVGSDISEDMLKLCNEKIAARPGAKARTLVADARATGLPDASVDYLMSIKFIKWLPTDEDVLSALCEFRRVCRKRCIVNVKIKAGDGLRQKLSALFKGFASEPQARSLSEDTFVNLCGKAGWRVREVRENPKSQGRVKFFTLE